jgi:hypothetical protein
MNKPENNRCTEITEADLAAPVGALFPVPSYRRFDQVPLSRKRIDLVFVGTNHVHTVSVELKIANWKKALWQANVNFQVSNESYIAIWHKYVHRVERHLDVLRAYGIGLIAVERESARIVLQSSEPIRRIPRRHKQSWYLQLLAQDQL